MENFASPIEPARPVAAAANLDSAALEDLEARVRASLRTETSFGLANLVEIDDESVVARKQRISDATQRYQERQKYIKQGF